ASPFFGAGDDGPCARRQAKECTAAPCGMEACITLRSAPGDPLGSGRDFEMEGHDQVAKPSDECLLPRLSPVPLPEAARKYLRLLEEARPCGRASSANRLRSFKSGRKRNGRYRIDCRDVDGGLSTPVRPEAIRWRS